jgi:glycine cleavage system H protein
MSVPAELLYTKDHEWVQKMTNGCVRVGITEHAQDAMGDLVFVDLPDLGEVFAQGDSCCVVESVKAVSDVYAPVSGTVSAVNDQLLDEPSLINQDCYGTWILEFDDIDQGSDSLMMSPAEYEQLLQEEN